MATTTADRATAALKSAFPGQVITAQDAPTEYSAAVNRPWSQTCWQSPAAFVQLTSAEEVAKALAIVRETGVKFAVRTTAHNPNANFNSTDGSGVVLDVHKLDARSLEKDVVRLGAGNLWGNVYEWLQEKNLSVIGGREKEVGLAGFLVYGGMGAFPSLAGFGADNVKNFEVVLADGRVVNANASSNPDLYVALKGGGSNFGIVTRFDLELHPLIKTQFSISLYNPTDYVNVLAATESFQKDMEQDAKLGLFTNVRSQIIAVGNLYAGETDKPPKAFEKFTSLSSFIAPVAPYTKGTLLELGNAMRHAEPPAKRTCFTVTTKPSHDLYVKTYEHYLTIIKDLPAGADFHWTIQPVTKSAVQAGEDRGGNIMGLQKIPQVWWVFTIEYPLDYDEATAVKAARDLSEHVATLAKSQDLFLNFLCPTFASSAQNVLRGYGEANVKKLRDAAAKYDPEGLFQKQQVGGFLLREA